MSSHPLVPGRKPDQEPSLPMAPVSPELELLRRWQAERLARTHADLLNHPAYGAACQFFLSDVYGPRDFTRRDEDLLQVYEAVHRILPPPIAKTFSLVIELNELTLDLDNRLLEVLIKDLGVTDSITPGQYAEAYRRCDNLGERRRQIDLITTLGRELDRLVRKPFVGLTLKMAHGPAHWMGWSELQEFLERGFAAFKALADAELFLKTIEEREMKILDQIYAGFAEPFKI